MLNYYHARTAILSAAAVSLVLVCPPHGQAQQADPLPGIARQSARPPMQTMELPSFVNLVKQHGATVVNIRTTRSASNPAGDFPFSEDDPFYEFFRRFMPPWRPGEPLTRSVGSGFIINPDGYILTNAHVVLDADEVVVRLTDKRQFKAKVIGADRYTDVALIKVEATGLPVVKMGDPTRLEPGEWVAAIGAPFGFENSVTAGVVSAKGRMLPNESYVPFIQTDVAVNPGNSGGPLFNLHGEVVGINTQIYSRTGGYMGLSFAIPIDIANDIATELRTTGKVTRGRIGVQVQELTVDLAASFGLKEPRGALVAAVEKGGPAEKAGVMPGDVILSVNRHPIQDSADLARVIAKSEPGRTAELEVWRKNRSIALQATVAEMEPMPSPAAESSAAKATARAGLVVGELADEQRRSLQIESGVLVHRAEGAAARAGLRPGDIIIRANDIPLKSVAELEAQLAKTEGKTVALLIRRGPDTIFVPLRLGGNAPGQR